ncbi:MAG: hypothetical protein GX660_09525 [Clostridiaceae bacterium]|nr:hypothetical protein [Clostridiaceae bacterium]
MLKKYILTIMSVIIMMGVSGCMANDNKVSVKDEVEKYMKDKYNEEFTYIGGGTEGWNAPEVEVYVSSSKFPEAKIMIRRGKESGDMIDNYMSFLMKSRIEEVMDAIAKDVYPVSKVYYSTDVSPLAGASPQMELDEYIKYSAKNLALSLTICVSDDEYKTNKDQKLEQLRSKFKEKEYKPQFRIIYVTEGKVDADPQTIRDATILKSALLFGDFKIDSSAYDEWREN